ncbi:trypsin-like peptidase domain-containing protein [Gemmatimonas aurantiaca]|nr:trypsin-like peptidase domain-containing protein [Gemmatimonas aurantiaca]
MRFNMFGKKFQSDPEGGYSLQSQQAQSQQVMDSDSGKKSENGKNSKTPYNRKFGRLALTAVTFTMVGILIATQMDFTGSTVASPQITPLISAVAPTGSTLKHVDPAVASPFVRVVELVSGAVVSVTGKKVRDGFEGRVRGKKATSSGTGFFFREDGYLLTNNHVVDGAEQIKVTTAAGFTYDARLVGLDPETDLAVLKVDTDDDIIHVSFGNSDSVRVGEWAIAIGNPFPQQGLLNSVTIGVVSAKGRSQLRFGSDSPTYQDYIQVDAAINPGNSGGPLFNINGEVIAVNSAISSPSGGSVGIGFSIPINIARAIIPDLIEYGEVRRGWLGVEMASLTQNDARRLQLDEVRGVMIVRVVVNSPASEAGLRKDDVVYEYNRQEVLNPSQFGILVSTTEQGSNASIKVIRDGERLTLTAKIADLKSGALIAAETQTPIEKFEWMGMELMTMTRNIALSNGLEYTPGALVNGVRRSGAGYAAGFEPGEIITEVGSQDIKNLGDLQRVVMKISDRVRTVSVIVVDRQGDTEYRQIRR